MDDIDEGTFQTALWEHARYLGMDPASDSDLLWLACESLTADVPEGWVCESEDTDSGAMYYVSTVTGEKKWDHPLDEAYRRRYLELVAARSEGADVSSAEKAEAVSHFRPVVYEGSGTPGQERSPSRGSLPKPLVRQPVTSIAEEVEVVEDDDFDDDSDVDAAMAAPTTVARASPPLARAPAHETKGRPALAPLNLSDLSTTSPARPAAAPAAAPVASPPTSFDDQARRTLNLAMSLMGDSAGKPSPATGAPGSNLTSPHFRAQAVSREASAPSSTETSPGRAGEAASHSRSRNLSMGSADRRSRGTHDTGWGDEDEDSTFMDIMTGGQVKTARSGVQLTSPKTTGPSAAMTSPKMSGVHTTASVPAQAVAPAPQPVNQTVTAAQPESSRAAAPRTGSPPAGAGKAADRAAVASADAVSALQQNSGSASTKSLTSKPSLKILPTSAVDAAQQIESPSNTSVQTLQRSKSFTAAVVAAVAASPKADKTLSRSVSFAVRAPAKSLSPPASTHEPLAPSAPHGAASRAMSPPGRLQAASTSDLLRGARSPVEPAIQRRVDRAVAAAKAEMEIELQRIKTQYANHGAKQAAELGRAQTERDEIAAKLVSTAGDLDAMRARLAGMTDSLSDHARRCSDAQRERDVARAEITELQSMLAASSSSSAEDIRKLQTDLMTIRQRLADEQAAREADRRSAATEAEKASTVADALRAENTQLRLRADQLQDALTAAKNELEAYTGRVSDVAASLQSAREAREQIDKELHDARSERRAMENAVQDLQRKLQASQEDGAALQARLEHATAHAQALRDGKDQAEKQAQLAHQELRALEVRSQETTRELATIAAENAALQERVAELGAARDEAVTQRQNLRAESDAKIAELERTLRELRGLVADLRATQDVSTAELTSQHERSLATAKLEWAQELSRCKADAERRSAEMHAAHEASVQQLRDARLDEVRKLQQRVFDAEAKAREVAEQAQQQLLERLREQERAAAARTAELEAVWDAKLRQAQESASSDIAKLDADRRTAQHQLSQVEGAAKLRAAELQSKVEAASKRAEELEKHVSALQESLDSERARAVRTLADAEAARRRALDDVAGEHRGFVASLQAEAAQEAARLKAALSEARDAQHRAEAEAREATEAKDAVARAAAEAQDRLRRAMEALRTTQTELQQLKAAAEHAGTDARLLELQAQLAAKETTVQRLTEEAGRHAAAARAAREAAAHQVEEMRAALRDTIDRETTAAADHAAKMTTAEWKARLANDVADMAMEKEQAVRRVTLLQEEVDRLTAQMQARTREIEVSAETRVATLRAELDRMVTGNSNLIVMLKEAQTEVAKLQASSGALQTQLAAQEAAAAAAQRDARSIAEASARILAPPSAPASPVRELHSRTAAGAEAEAAHVLAASWRRHGVPADMAHWGSPKPRRSRSADPMSMRGQESAPASPDAKGATETAALRDQVALLAAEVRQLRTTRGSDTPAQPHAARADHVIDMIATAAANKARAQYAAEASRQSSAQSFFPPDERAVPPDAEAHAGHDLTMRAAAAEDATVMGLARQLELSSTTQAVLQQLGLPVRGRSAVPDSTASSFLEPLPDMSAMQMSTSDMGTAAASGYKAPVIRAPSRASSVLAALAAPSPSVYGSTPRAGSAAGWGATRGAGSSTPSSTSSVWYQPGYWREKYGGATPAAVHAR